MATLMSRLRNVDGVTRVSLGKSLKPAPTAGAAQPSPRPRRATPTTTTATPCPGERPPTFELVIFFEGSEVPASVAGHHRPGPPPRRR